MIKSKFLTKSLSCALLISAVLAFTGCSNSSSMDITKIKTASYIENAGSYTGFTFEQAANTEVTEEEIQSYVDYLLQSFGEPTKTDKQTVELGDVANIDFKGMKDGVAFDGGTSQGYDLTIGSNMFIPGFEDGLIGVNVGETVNLDLTFPENYQSEELAGQAVVFEVKVNYISKAPTELTDDIIARLQLEGISTADEFLTFLRNYLAESKEAEAQNGLKKLALAEVKNNITLKDKDLPKGLMDYYTGRIKETDQMAAHNYNMSLDDYIVGYRNIDVNSYDYHVEQEAAVLAEEDVICGYIAAQEKIAVSDEEFNAKLEEDAASNGVTVDEYKAEINVDAYKNEMLKDKVLNFVIENSTVSK